MRVCYGLERSEFLRVVEDDGGEGGAIDLAGFDHLRPPSRHPGEGSPSGPQHLVPDGVGVDRMDTVGMKKPPHLAFSRSEAAAHNPTALLSTHRTGR